MVAESQLLSVTAEHPRIAPAGRSTRLLAFLIDLLLIALAQSPWLLLRNDAIVNQAAESTWVLLAVGAAGLVPTLILGVLNVHHLLARGQTLGKAALSVRIADAQDDSRVGFVRLILVRGLLNGVLSVVPGYIILDGLFIFKRDQRCLHDRLAGTHVIPTPERRLQWSIPDRIAAGLCVLLGLAVAGIAILTIEPEREFAPIITLGVSWPGAEAEEVESSLTVPLETTGAKVSGVAGTRSLSSFGRSVVALTFPGGFDADLALERTRETFAKSPPHLPPLAEEIEFRQIGRRELILVVTGDASREILSWVARTAMERLEREPGVRWVETIGADSSGLIVGLDEITLRQFGISAEDVVAALKKVQVLANETDTSPELRGLEDLPLVNSRSGEILVRANKTGTSPELRGLEDLPLVTRQDGEILRLSDIATLTKTDLHRSNQAWCLGELVVILRLGLAYNADVEALSNRVDEIGRESPTSVQFRVWNEVGGGDHNLVDVLLHHDPTEHTFHALQKTLAQSPRLAGGLILNVDQDKPDSGAHLRLLLAATDAAEAAAIVGDLAGIPSIRIRKVATATGMSSLISVRVMADDLSRIEAAVEELQRRLADVSGVRAAWHYRLLPRPTITIRLKPEGRFLDLDDDGIARALLLRSRGIRAGTLLGGPVLVRIGDGDPSLGDLEDMPILTSRGREAPLRHVAEVYRRQGPTCIQRVDGRRAITLTALIDSEESYRRVRERAREALGDGSDVGVELRWED